MTVCGQNNIKSIVSDEVAPPHAWPWQAVVYAEKQGTNLTTFCGGSLINHRYILSAAHCLKGHEAKDVRIGLGVYNLTSAKRKDIHRVNKIIVHPKYDEKTLRNDISLIKLEKRVDFSKTIAPICLADNSMSKINLDNVPAVLTGWGSTNTKGPGSQLLKQGVISIVHKTKCREAYDNKAGEGVVTTLNICAGLEKGKKNEKGKKDEKSRCYADPGGPLSVKFEESWTQVGIVSWGANKGCAIARKFALFNNE